MKQLKSHTALQNYLDGLLQSADAVEAQPQPEESVPAPRPVLLKDVSVQPLVLPTLTAHLQPAPEAAPPESVDERPDWSAHAIECLLFEVAGLKLAVPLMCLGSIYPLQDDAITPLFGQPEWFVGMLRTPVGNLNVLDSARWIMPERYKPDLREGFKYVISINGHNWGLAVNEVHESVLLQPDGVKWRHQRSNRKWLAGTVIEHMCALLDVEALALLVQEKQQPTG